MSSLTAFAFMKLSADGRLTDYFSDLVNEKYQAKLDSMKESIAELDPQVVRELFVLFNENIAAFLSKNHITEIVINSENYLKFRETVLPLFSNIDQFNLAKSGFIGKEEEEKLSFEDQYTQEYLFTQYMHKEEMGLDDELADIDLGDLFKK